MHPHRLQHERQQARRHLLARGNHGVIFTRVIDIEVRTFGLGCFLHPAHKFVRLAGHRRDHHSDLMARIDLTFDVPRHIADAGDVGDGGSAEFHHDTRHGADKSLKCGPVLEPRKSLTRAPRLPWRECAVSIAKSPSLRKRT